MKFRVAMAVKDAILGAKESGVVCLEAEDSVPSPLFVVRHKPSTELPLCCSRSFPIAPFRLVMISGLAYQPNEMSQFFHERFHDPALVVVMAVALILVVGLTGWVLRDKLMQRRIRKRQQRKREAIEERWAKSQSTKKSGSAS